MLPGDFSGIELDERRPVSVQFIHGYRESEIVQQQELQLEMVEFGQGQTPNLW